MNCFFCCCWAHKHFNFPLALRQLNLNLYNIFYILHGVMHFYQRLQMKNKKTRADTSIPNENNAMIIKTMWCDVMWWDKRVKQNKKMFCLHTAQLIDSDHNNIKNVKLRCSLRWKYLFFLISLTIIENSA